ncbi:MAG: Mrp/NBP35 family ATP-binding protein [Nocardioidaceae bacterium]|nr:Mrp/NBP35 family ATP-binding protein [Nocardioidaceae bacterium]
MSRLGWASSSRAGADEESRRLAVEAAVGAVVDPQLTMPLTQLGMVEQVTVPRRGPIRVLLRTIAADCPQQPLLTSLVEQAVGTVDPGREVAVEVSVMDARARTAVGQLLRSRAERSRLTSRRQVYAVASGKGGVGKSTVTANLAVALAAQGQRVGVLDADVWGYSLPRLFGVRYAPVAVAGMMLPVLAQGLQLMSVGFFLPADEPVLWRGPMLHKAIEQFVHDVAWGDLDVLLVDLPPGTGDVQMSLLEQLPDAAFVVVTTPQAAAVDVAARVGRMALDARLPIAGVVENMAGVACRGCGEINHVFGSDGGAELAGRLGAPLLGSVPLDAAARASGDAGVPVVTSTPDSPAAVALAAIAHTLPVVRRSLVGRSLPLSVV